MQAPQVISILEIIAPAALGFVLIIAGAAVAFKWIDNRGKRIIPGDAAAQARIEERLNHLTNAVDAIAVEIERISEGQRFTTKLLADTSGGVGAADHEALPSELRR
jgi:hypothetical protein